MTHTLTQVSKSGFKKKCPQNSTGRVFIQKIPFWNLMYATFEEIAREIHRKEEGAKTLKADSFHPEHPHLAKPSLKIQGDEAFSDTGLSSLESHFLCEHWKWVHKPTMKTTHSRALVQDRA